MNILTLEKPQKDDVRHVRIDYNVKTGQVDIHSSIGDPKLDLEALLEGVALSVAINAKIQKKSIEELAKQVYHNVEKVAKSKQNYIVTHE